MRRTDGAGWAGCARMDGGGVGGAEGGRAEGGWAEGGRKEGGRKGEKVASGRCVCVGGGRWRAQGGWGGQIGREPKGGAGGRGHGRWEVRGQTEGGRKGGGRGAGQRGAEGARAEGSGPVDGRPCKGT